MDKQKEKQTSDYLVSVMVGRREFEQEFAKVRSSSGELSKNAYFAREARKIRKAAAFLSSAMTVEVRISASGLGNGFCFSVSRTKRKADKRLLACFLVRETGIEPVR